MEDLRYTPFTHVERAKHDEFLNASSNLILDFWGFDCEISPKSSHEDLDAPVLKSNSIDLQSETEILKEVDFACAMEPFRFQLGPEPVTQEVIIKDGIPYSDVAPLVHLPMRQAASRLGMPCSTLGKRWKATTLGREWPHRSIKRIERSILLLLHNHSDLTPEDQEKVLQLVYQRKAEGRSVVIEIGRGR